MVKQFLREKETTRPFHAGACSATLGQKPVDFIVERCAFIEMAVNGQGVIDLPQNFDE